ncbi:MAG: hypothetical protein WBP45_01220 [Daejeonella sp.]
MSKFLLLTVFLFFPEFQSYKNIKDYFKAFPFKEDFVSLKEGEHNHPNIDEKNKYISIKYEDADYSYKYGGEIQFTYFIKGNGKRLFAYSSFSEGPSSYVTEADFYTFEKNKWNKVTDRVIPQLNLQLFGLADSLAERIGDRYHIRFELPQKGTFIKLSVYPVGENDNPFSSSVDGYTEYTELIKSLKPVTLKWNKEKGTFSVRSN